MSQTPAIELFKGEREWAFKPLKGKKNEAMCPGADHMRAADEVGDRLREFVQAFQGLLTTRIGSVETLPADELA